MSTLKSCHKFILSIALIFQFNGCGTRTGNPSLNVNGTVILGPVANATVSVYVLNADGSRGSLLGSAVTSTTGAFSIPLQDSGPITLVLTGGSYQDEATNTTVNIPANFELEALAPVEALRASLNLHGVSTVAAARARTLAPTQGLENAYVQSASDTAGIFGLSGFDPNSVLPDNFTIPGGVPNVSANSAKLGLVVSGLSQLMVDQSLQPLDQLAIIQNVAHDYSDGIFDGKNASGASVPNTLSLTPKQAINGLATAMTNFLNSTRNASGWRSSDFGSYPPAITY